jgi:methyl-accepting chemotaxis protein
MMRSTDRVIADGNGALQDMTAAMQEINSSSDRIRKIIKVIDEIAFQTNILALNAAVEAARAGEAGLGFAVVADEVRNLARRCATAAQETALLIEESTVKSAEGGAKLEWVQKAMGGITTASGQVRAMAERLTGSSQEQARGIQQIGQALQQIEQVTQSNVVAANDSAGAGSEMVHQAEGLGEIVLALMSMVGEPARELAGREHGRGYTRRDDNEE